ncbi:MAG: protein kinase, partial [Deltaproteobacteria bacterium]|nr:protein kinase [Deltaproteobacteria bacterium]
MEDRRAAGPGPAESGAAGGTGQSGPSAAVTGSAAGDAAGAGATGRTVPASVPAEVSGTPQAADAGLAQADGAGTAPAPVGRRAGARALPGAAPFGLRSFLGYPVDRVLSSAGGEADIYVIRDGNSREYVLRLFRQGREPKPEVFGRLVELSSRLGGRICQTYQTGRDEATSRFYEIQEYVRGGDLAGYFAGGRLTPSAFRELAGQLAAALDALHREGLVHRDVKPDNILVRSRTPLAVALADFGISSVMAPGISVKGTGAANTPLYSAPESYADFAGAAGDFWSLGAVLLEGLLGRHPLAGLSVNHVMREISLRGLAVPPEIRPPEADLLKGLLTRDDRRRWGAAETARWAAGETGIRVFYEDPAGRAGPEAGRDAGGPGVDAVGPGSRPYRFRSREYRSTADLAEAFDSSPEDWAQGREHLMRGYVRAHMEDTGRSEGARLITRIEGLGLGPDETLFAFIQNFRARARHAWRGLPLTRMRILELLDESLASGEDGRTGPGAAGGPGGARSDAGAGAVPGGAGSGAGRDGTPAAAAAMYLEEILGGRLSALPDVARKAGNPLDRTLEALLAFGSPVTRETLRTGLDASLTPDAFVWGMREPPAPGPDALLFALHAGAPLLSWTRFWTLVPRKAVLPLETVELLSDPAGYDQGARTLALLASSGALRAGVGRDLPDLAPWKASGGKVSLADATAEDFLDAAEDMKDRAAELAESWGPGWGRGAGLRGSGRWAQGAGGGMSGGGSGGGIFGAGSAGGPGGGGAGGGPGAGPAGGGRDPGARVARGSLSGGGGGPGGGIFGAGSAGGPGGGGPGGGPGAGPAGGGRDPGASVAGGSLSGGGGGPGGGIFGAGSAGGP